MKYIALLLLVVALALPACGASPLKAKLSLSVSAMQFNDTDLQDYLGTPLGFNLGYKLTEESNMETGVSIGYFSATHAAVEPIVTALGSRAVFPSFVGYKMTTIPVMITQRWKFGSGTGFRPYVGYGLGFNWTQQKWDLSFVPSLENAQARNMIPIDLDRDSITRLMGAAQLTAGAEFGNGYFIDLKYISGSEDITTGYTASLGKSF